MDEELSECHLNRSRRKFLRKLSARAMVAILAVCIGVVLFAYVAFASAISGAVHNEPTTLRQTIFVSIRWFTFDNARHWTFTELLSWVLVSLIYRDP